MFSVLLPAAMDTVPTIDLPLAIVSVVEAPPIITDELVPLTVQEEPLRYCVLAVLFT